MGFKFFRNVLLESGKRRFLWTTKRRTFFSTWFWKKHFSFSSDSWAWQVTIIERKIIDFVLSKHKDISIYLSHTWPTVLLSLSLSLSLSSLPTGTDKVKHFYLLPRYIGPRRLSLYLAWYRQNVPTSMTKSGLVLYVLQMTPVWPDRAIFESSLCSQIRRMFSQIFGLLLKTAKFTFWGTFREDRRAREFTFCRNLIHRHKTF